MPGDDDLLGLTAAAPPVRWTPPGASPEASLVGAPILNTPGSSAGAAPRSGLVGGVGSGVAPTTTPSLPSLLRDVNPDARGIRNNNPGNLEANAFTAAMSGYVGSDGRFAKFATPEDGIAALKRNLESYAVKGISTPLAVASTWAPGSEKGNDPVAYGSAIAKELGVGVGDKVNLSDPAVQDKIARAIVQVENGGGGGSVAGPNASPTMPGSTWVPPSPSSASPAELLSGEMKLALVRSLFPQHLITPVEYDPFAELPKGLGKKVNVNEGAG